MPSAPSLVTRPPRIVVVGAGIGGLAAALDLAVAGFDVQLLERAPGPGGKLREVTIAERPLDAGPTVLTMRWVFDALFERAGTRLEDQLPLRAAEVLARHAWGDGQSGQRLDLHADVARSADAIGHFAGPADARGYRDFCRRAQRTYQALEAPYLRAARTSPWGLVGRAGWRGLPDLARISPFQSLWQALGQHFRDPRLRQLFGRYATYCGSSPMLAPATLMLVAHVEQQGVYFVDGGMHRIATAVAALATRHGVRLRYGADVREIVVARGRATGVRLGDGESIDADAVLFNGDAAALAAGQLGAAVAAACPRQPASRRSLSAVTWNLVARTTGFPLLRHTVFFSDDYPAEFDALRCGRLPASPTVYVCAQDRDDRDATVPSADGERLLCLVNAPSTGDTHPATAQEIAACERQTFEALARCGLQIERRPERTLTTTPADFARRYPATGGALYGPASHGWLAAFQRPGTTTLLPGLYLAGGSVHPGPGLPMAALSGRLAAQQLVQDLRPVRTSIAWSPPVATPGGTSMR